MTGRIVYTNPLRRYIFTAILAAMAAVLMQLLGFPVVPSARFLKYEPSGAVILLAGIFMGPAAAAECAIVKCVLYFLLHGGNPFGHISDLLSMLTFSVTAAAVMYSGRNKTHSLLKRIIACAIACVVTVIVMSLANYPILYMQYGTNTAGVTAMQVYLIPFNFIKTGLNSLIALLAYEPLYRAVSAVSKEKSAE